MQIENVVLLDDLLRAEFLAAREFIYTVLQEPISQALGIGFPDTRKFPQHRGLMAGFDVAEFKNLCGSTSWVDVYHEIPGAAADYLCAHVPPNSLVVGYEMPRWLISILTQRNILFVDTRISPIKFARDLYLVMQGNLPNFIENTLPMHVSAEELRLEAGLLRASVQQNDTGSRSVGALRDGVLFVGQTRADASLVSDEGKILEVGDFEKEIHRYANGRQIVYKPHPYDASFAKSQRKRLQVVLNQKIPTTQENIYNLLASRAPFDVLAISSGACQEASFFQRSSRLLFRPICDPFALSETGERVSAHVRFGDFISPRFWAGICERPNADLLVQLPLLSENLMRRLHNVWWGYADYVIDGDKFWRRVLVRGIRNLLRRG